MPLLIIFLFLFSPLFAIDVCFLAKNPGPQEHFKTFLKVCEREKIAATLVSKIDEIPKEARLLISDAADLNFAFDFPGTHYIYYDNPENFVPGGYSQAVSQRLKENVQGVIFANARLATDPELKTKLPRLALGFYPLDDVEKLVALRKKMTHAKPIIVYVGGANETYYTLALPHFLKILRESNLANCTLIFQRHPRAVGDLKMLVEARSALASKGIEVVISSEPLLQTAAKADTILYYQTSTAAKFALAGIPLIQVGHEAYPDLLVKNRLIASVTTAKELEKHLKTKESFVTKEIVLHSLGVSAEWERNLLSILNTKPGKVLDKLCVQ